MEGGRRREVGGGKEWREGGEGGRGREGGSCHCGSM